MTDWHRRTLLKAAPALGLVALAGKASAGLEQPNDPIQQTLARVWPKMAGVPAIRVPARNAGPTPVIAYMFTNVNCLICQSVHREFPKGFRDLEMRYIIYPWPGEDLHVLNYMYRPETTEADYNAYMGKRLPTRAADDSITGAAKVMNLVNLLSKELIEGGGFGTPFFLYASPGKTAGTVSFSAGDIATAGPMLDAHGV